MLDTVETAVAELPKNTRQFYLLLGCWPGDVLDGGIAAAVGNCPQVQAEAQMGILAAAQLLVDAAPNGWYRPREVFDDQRRRAAETASEDLPELEAEHALVTRRIAEYFLARLSVADELVAPGRLRLDNYVADYRPADLPQVQERAAALDWAEQQLDNILLAAHAVHQLLPPLCFAVLERLWPVLVERKLYPQRPVIDELFLRAAGGTLDEVLVAEAMKRSGMHLLSAGDFTAARQQLEMALKLWGDVGSVTVRRRVSAERTIQQRALATEQQALITEQLALLRLAEGGGPDAAVDAVAMLRGCWQSHLASGASALTIALVVNNLVIAMLATGQAAEIDQAAGFADQALQMLHAIPDTFNIARALTTCARVQLVLDDQGRGNLRHAAAYAAGALDLALTLRAPSETAAAQRVLAEVAGRRGDHARARDLLEEALRQFEAIGSPVAPAARAELAALCTEMTS